jgi:hypothetical protein
VNVFISDQLGQTGPVRLHYADCPAGIAPKANPRSVGRPRGCPSYDLTVGEVGLARPVCVHYIDVSSAASSAHKRYHAAVGRPRGLCIPDGAVGQVDVSRMVASLLQRQQAQARRGESGRSLDWGAVATGYTIPPDQCPSSVSPFFTRRDSGQASVKAKRPAAAGRRFNTRSVLWLPHYGAVDS